MMNIGLLLILIVYIFAIIGMNFFANIKQEAPLSARNNFQNFSNSLVAIFRMSTGEGWGDLVLVLSRNQSTIGHTCIQDP
jgi:hypothetical protein